MADSKHTAGNWTIGRTTEEKLEIYIDGNHRASVLPFGAKPTEEDEANAKLIAAAPDMLKALQFFLKDNDMGLITQASETMARFAIKKATDKNL